MTGRVPASEAERMLMAAVLDTAGDRAAAEAVDELRPADFAEDRHGGVLAAAGRLLAQGVPVTPISVGDDLRRTSPELARAEDLDAWLWAQTDWAHAGIDVAYYAGIVREAATLRRLDEAGQRLRAAAAEPGTTPAQALEAARAELDAIEGRGRATITPALDDVDAWLADIATPARLVPTPWEDLTALTGGLSMGALVVVGGRPGHGKSIVGLQMALAALSRGPVVYISLEMSRDDVLARVAAQRAGVDVGQIIRHQLRDDELAAVHDAMREIAGDRLYVATTGEVRSISDALAYVRGVHRAEQGLALVVVDYLQLLVSDEKPETRQVEVAGFSRALKLSAGQLGVPVVALSQLRRREHGAPQLIDLRESGAIEQDADLVMLLHRPDQDEDAGEVEDDVLTIDVAKARNGRLGRVELDWDGAHSRVHTRTWARSWGNPGPTEPERSPHR